MDNKAFDHKGVELGYMDTVVKPEFSNGIVLPKGEAHIQETVSEEDWPEDMKRKERRRIMKNIILISIGFLLNFTSFNGLSRLQSSLHQDQGMGTINSAVLYGALVLSCLLLPKIAISKLGYKWCIVISVLGYILWMGANGIGRWWSMTPASIIVGVCAAPLWTAQCSYFTKLAIRYSKLVGETQETIVSRFFGIFFMFFQMSSIFGSVISSTILNQPVNGTRTPPTEDALRHCGVHDCPGNNVTNVNLQKPPPVVVWTMVGVFMGVAAGAVIVIAIFMDKLPKELEDEEEHVSFRKDTPKLLVATAKHWRHIPQLLLIPLTMYSGFEQAYFNAEWSRSFISCALGIWMVGFATLPYGFVNAFFSFTTGRLVKYIGRIPIFTAAMCMDIGIQITLYTWQPHPSQPVVFYVISGCWGFSDAIWQTQINALYGSIFTTEPEAAFANYRMFESFGFIIAFAYSSALCTLVKTAVLTSVLILGMSGYYATEVVVRKQKSFDVSNAPAT